VALRAEGAPRVLVGAQFGQDERAAFDDARWPVEVLADPAALKKRAWELDVWIIVVDHGLPGLSKAFVAGLKSPGPKAPVVLGSHSQVCRMLKMWRDLSCHADDRLFDATSRDNASAFTLALSTLLEGWTRERSWSWAGACAEPERSSSGHDDPMSLLVRPRSSAEETDLKRRALEATFRERERLLQDSLSTQQVAALLRVSRQTPHDRVRAKGLLAIEDTGGLKFPLWQFDAEGPGGVVQGLPEVLGALKVGELAKARWLERPNPVLENRSPIDALKAGEVERVVREARSVGASAGHG
jgi:hypothetical protein